MNPRVVDWVLYVVGFGCTVAAAAVVRSNGNGVLAGFLLGIGCSICRAGGAIGGQRP